VLCAAELCCSVTPARAARAWRRNLDHNMISSVPSGAFSGTIGLVTLTLNANSITTVAAGAFSNLASLQTLILDNKKIAHLAAGSFTGLTTCTSPVRACAGPHVHDIL
jgi:hypothetical protein